MASGIVIREYRSSDLDKLIEVFIQAIRLTASRDYGEAQIAAWAQADRDVWQEKRSSRRTLVATVEDEVAGFADLEPDGHLDMMYVHPRFQGRGTASALVAEVKSRAVLAGLQAVHTEASLTARPFFESMGFTVVAPERVFRNGQWFDRFKMRWEP